MNATRNRTSTATLRARSFGAAALLAAGLLSTPAAASVTLYTDRAAYEAAAGAQTLIDFEGIVPEGTAQRFDMYSEQYGLSLGGVQFLGYGSPGAPSRPNQELWLVSDTYDPNGSHDWGTGDTLGGDRDGTVEATLPGGAYSVGMDYMLVLETGARPAGNVILTLWTGSTSTDFTLSTVANGVAFAGFVSTDAITSIWYRALLTDGHHPYGKLDNFSFDATASAPEPAALVLLGAGAGAAALRARRRGA